MADCNESSDELTDRETCEQCNDFIDYLCTACNSSSHSDDFCTNCDNMDAPIKECVCACKSLLCVKCFNDIDTIDGKCYLCTSDFLKKKVKKRFVADFFFKRFGIVNISKFYRFYSCGMQPKTLVDECKKTLWFYGYISKSDLIKPGAHHIFKKWEETSTSSRENDETQ